MNNYLKGPLLLFMLIVLSACSQQSPQVSIKLGHGLDTQHPVHLGMQFMADELAKSSNGTMKIDIYPNQQLGSERQTLELLQIGSVGMTKVSAAVLENFAPNVKVVSLPYIFSSKAHSHAVMDSDIGRDLLTESEQFWLRGLTFYDAGSRSYYSNDKPINTPDDLKGLKIRVQPSVTAMSMVSAMGGAPTPIAWGELYTALQQGVVDGAENNPPSFYYSRHYEVSKFYSINEHTSVPDVLMISTHLWNRLNEQQQAWLQAAADASSVHQRKLWAEAEEEALNAVKAAGVKVIYPDKKPFADAVQAMFEEYKSSPEVYDYIKRIKAMDVTQ
ncbi:TRAP transporter substrate-binding protein [Glaciecola sp. KUL10]|uniref:TRAP transporter substrate-binding protein n=1 Tax=Glaciecola sp. (strain KUL10) TaxID=2161813 RepID=UPI000D8D077B|nr:TRAP transporter substrate-binding protein [Glaciecola sp. KUL10]GBL05966.1 tripartite ATP-independent periplasmic transporter solute receptor, DctP family [Glaciecola sp. KUL10]